MSDIKKEYKNFLQDLEKNIKNKEDLEYTKSRATVFMNSVLDYAEYILKYKEGKITAIEKLQEELEKKMDGIEKNIEEIKQDIYLEDYEDISEIEAVDNKEKFNSDEYDTEIICPYCESEILVDLSQDINEIQCPECNNIIELEWSGNLEGEMQNKFEGNCKGGHCSNCKGCSNDDEDDVL